MNNSKGFLNDEYICIYICDFNMIHAWIIIWFYAWRFYLYIFTYFTKCQYFLSCVMNFNQCFRISTRAIPSSDLLFREKTCTPSWSPPFLPHQLFSTSQNFPLNSTSAKVHWDSCLPRVFVFRDLSLKEASYLLSIALCFEIIGMRLPVSRWIFSSPSLSLL